MIRRPDSLAETLHDIERGALVGVGVIVVSRAWWDDIMVGEQTLLRRRCEWLRVALHADDALPRHAVEVASQAPDPPRASVRAV